VPPPQLTVQEVAQTEGPYVVRALRYFGVPESDIKDVCQEVFIVVHRKLAEFEHRSSIRTWLFRICQRAASDFRKRAHVRREVATAEPISGNVVDKIQTMEAFEARAILTQALEHLDEDKRTVFVLFEIEGLTMKEVTEVVGCPLQTAYSRLHAARKILADVVTKLRLGVA